MSDLGTLGGPFDFSRALAIENRSQVVGDSIAASGTPHAFLWERGAMTDLGTLGGCCSTAFPINERGQIAGSANILSGFRHAALWQRKH